MSASLSLPQPEEVFQAAQSAETSLRQRYFAIDSDAPLPEISPDSEQLLEQSAAFLELALGSACLLELTREKDAPPHEPMSAAARSYFVDRVKHVCGVDLEVVIPRAIRTLALPKPIGKRPALPTPEALLRSIRSLIEACPIDYLEALGREIGLDSTAHRCRMAYDMLRAYVVRNDTSVSARLKLVGRGYSEGVLSAADVATLLDVSVTDALAMLESHGHQRTIDVISLDSQARASRLSAIRKDRLHRSGSVDFSRELLIQDVVASERIENVDARHWLSDEMM